jgi:hypothetical protein
MERHLGIHQQVAHRLGADHSRGCNTVSGVPWPKTQLPDHGGRIQQQYVGRLVPVAFFNTNLLHKEGYTLWPRWVEGYHPVTGPGIGTGRKDDHLTIHADIMGGPRKAGSDMALVNGAEDILQHIGMQTRRCREPHQ